MTKAEQTKAIAQMDAAFRALLKTLPLAFRERYADEILQLYTDCARDVLMSRGTRGYVQFWILACFDLLQTSFGEHVARLDQYLNRGGIMTRTIHAEGHEFGQRLSSVLEAEPAYYPVLVSVQPTRDVCEVAESIALEGDLAEPDSALHLFKELSDKPLTVSVGQWLERLCLAAQSHFKDAPAPESDSPVEHLLHRIFADAELFNLIAISDVGSSIFDIVESLALEGNTEDIEPMLAMMHWLAT